MKSTHQDGLIRHSALLLIATQIGNVCTMLFQILMMRCLSVVEYGVLASMLSLVMIIGTPLEALRTTVAHQTALFTRLNQSHAIRPFLRGWVRRLMFTAAVIVVIGLLFNGHIATFFHLPARWPVVITILIIAGSLFMPLLAGALQGVQAFIWMAAHAQMWPVIRFIVAVILTSTLGRTAMAGLSAQSIAVLASVGFGLFAWSRIIPRRDDVAPVEVGKSHYFLQSLFVLSGYAVLMNADIALVKRFFDPAEAGTFAQAATIGRSVIFLPMPIAAVMFPKVVSAGVSTVADRRILIRAISLTAALVASAALVCTLAVDIIWQIFTGETADDATRQLVRWVIWAMLPLGLTFLLMNFEIAQRRFRAPYMLIGLAVLYIAGVSIWHASYAQVLTVMTVVTSTSLVVMLVDMLRATRRPAAAGVSNA